MGRIGDRCRTAVATPAPDVTRVSRGRILPFSCCREFLETHPIVSVMRISAPDIHKAILHLDAHVTRTTLAATETTRHPQPDAGSVADDDDDDAVWDIFDRTDSRAKTSSRCFECHTGYIFTDEHNGYDVCGSCGLVQTRRTVNISPEYVKGVTDPPRNRAHGIRGVPKWLVKRVECAGDDRRVEFYMDDLEHMNQYTHLGTDEMKQCERWLQEWAGGHFGREVRLAAAVLYPTLMGVFMTQEDARRRVRTVVQRIQTEDCAGQTRPTWSMGGMHMDVCPRDVVPEPTFACADCGARQHSRKAARYHCSHAGPYAAM